MGFLHIDKIKLIIMSSDPLHKPQKDSKFVIYESRNLKTEKTETKQKSLLLQINN